MGMDERDLRHVQPAKLYLEGSLLLLVCLVEKYFLKKKRWINSIKEIYFSISRKIYT